MTRDSQRASIPFGNPASNSNQIKNSCSKLLEDIDRSGKSLNERAAEIVYEKQRNDQADQIEQLFTQSNLYKTHVDLDFVKDNDMISPQPLGMDQRTDSPPFCVIQLGFSNWWVRLTSSACYALDQSKYRLNPLEAFLKLKA